MTKFGHFALIVLGVAGTILTVFGQIPKYAGFATSALLLVADAKRLLAPKGTP